MTLRARPTAIPGVLLLETERHADARGFVAELTNVRDLAALGVASTWVQDNLSVSPRAPTLRGLHFQTPPHAQAKLVRVLRGAAHNVAVDLRRGSPTFGRHAAATLSGNDLLALYVPRGFAHGLITLEPGTEVFYKLDAYRAVDRARGLAWDDPELGIEWPVARSEVLVSDRDAINPRLRDLGAPFPAAG